MCDCGAPCSSRIGGPDPPMTPLISDPLVFTVNALKPGKYFSVLGAAPSCAITARSNAGDTLEATPSAAICLRRRRRFMWQIVMQNSEGSMQKGIQKPGKQPCLHSEFCVTWVSEKETHGKHWQQHHADEQPRTCVAHVERVTEPETFLDPDGRVFRIEVEETADLPSSIRCRIAVDLAPGNRGDGALSALTDTK